MAAWPSSTSLRAHKTRQQAKATMRLPLWLLLHTTCTLSIPFQITVNPRTNECLYESLNEGEHATVSLFILSGSELKGDLLVDGPVAPLDVTSGTTLQEALNGFDRDEALMKYQEKVDFEDLNDIEEEESDSLDAPVPEDETAEQRKERRAKERKRALERRQKKEQNKQKQQSKVRSEGEPFMYTWKAPKEGWYRVCVHAPSSQISAEIDLRKETEAGGLNENGHVFTKEEQELDEEDKLMDHDTAAEEGIKDEDFASTRDKLKTLRRLLADIQSKQQQERHRLIVHSATNEHSHSRMVLGSLVETCLFMLVTGHQVWTIRRWFRGAPVLGR